MKRPWVRGAEVLLKPSGPIQGLSFPGLFSLPVSLFFHQVVSNRVAKAPASRKQSGK